jgi:hypothetical protein
MWLIVGSRGYIPSLEGAGLDDHSPTSAYPGYGFADDLSVATFSLGKLHVKLRKLSLFSDYTGLDVNARKCSATGALSHKGNANSKDNRALLEHDLSTLSVDVHKVPTPLPTLPPTEYYKVLGVELNNTMSFTTHCRDLRR